MSKEIIFLLGRRDFPTDGVFDYCQLLGKQISTTDYNFQLIEIPWQNQGFFNSYGKLWQDSKSWNQSWVLLQYTNFSWAFKGFPLGFLIAILLLKFRGCKVGFICHERYDFPAQRLVDKFRRWFQFKTLQIAYYWCEKIILTLPPKVTPWLPKNPIKAKMIQVGSTVELLSNKIENNQFNFDGKTVAIFGITGGNVEGEVKTISYALKQAFQKVPNLRLLAVGRDTDLGKDLLAKELKETSIKISILGLISSSQIAEAFAASDVFLFVRGCLSTGRSSAIAGIASQLPMVAYAGAETAFPLTEAGVMLIPQGDKEKLAQALTQVLSDDSFREELKQRSIKAYHTYFTWEAIANKFINVLEEKEEK